VCLWGEICARGDEWRPLPFARTGPGLLPRERLVSLEGHCGSVLCARFSPAGGLLATCAADRTCRLWRAEGGLCERALEGHRNSVCSVAFSPDGAFVATGSTDGSARLWDVAGGGCLQAMEGHAEGLKVRSLGFSPAGSMLATGSDDGTVNIWHLGTGQHYGTLGGHPLKTGQRRAAVNATAFIAGPNPGIALAG